MTLSFSIPIPGAPAAVGPWIDVSTLAAAGRTYTFEDDPAAQADIIIQHSDDGIRASDVQSLRFTTNDIRTVTLSSKWIRCKRLTGTGGTAFCHVQGDPGPAASDSIGEFLSGTVLGVDLATGSGTYAPLIQIPFVLSAPGIVRVDFDCSHVCTVQQETRFRCRVDATPAGLFSGNPIKPVNVSGSAVFVAVPAGSHTAYVEWLRVTAGTASCRPASQPANEAASMAVYLVG